MADPRPSLGLIARDRELSDLDCALWQSRQGGATIAVLRGEPGIGKSALIAAATARARDFNVIQLRGDLTSRTAWPQVLAELLAESGGPGGDAGSEPERTAEAVRSLVSARSAPALVAIDDAHLLPTSFLRSLVAAVDGDLVGHPLMAVIAIRDLPHTELVDLPVPAAVERRLTGLTIEQSLTLLNRIDGRHPQPEVARALYYGVGGNPQALLSAYARVDSEVLRGWRALAEPVRPDDALLEAFGSCLVSLPEGARRALAAAASGRVPLRVLEAALEELGLDMGSFEPAEQRGIVLLRRSRIDFLHPLVRAAAYYNVPGELRALVHEAVSRAAARAGLIEMGAMHASRSGSGPAAAVVQMFGQAARVALDRGDMAAAARYEEAMARIEESDESAVYHLVQAASRWLCVGELDRADYSVEQAEALQATDQLRAQLAYWRSRIALARSVDRQVAAALADSAESLRGPAPGSAAMMLADAALCLLFSGAPADADALAVRALEAAAQAAGFAGSYASAVLPVVRLLSHQPGADVEQLRSATAFLTSQPEGVPLSPLFAYAVGTALLDGLGPEAATTWATFIERSAAATGNVSLTCVPPLLGAAVGSREGRLEEAGRQAAAAGEAALESGQQFMASRAIAQQLEIEGMQGSYKEAFATAARLFSADSAGGSRARAYKVLAELELQQGRHPSALGWLKAAEFEAGPAAGRHRRYEQGGDHLCAPAALAEILVHDQQLAAVRPLVEQVEQAAIAGGLAAAWGPALRGVVTDDLGASEDLFRRALHLSRGQPLLQARVEYLYSARLVEAGMAERAARRLRSAVRTALEIGARGWALCFEVALERLGVAADRVDLALLKGGSGLAAPAPTGVEAAPPPLSLAGEDGAARDRMDPAAAWEIRMLGSFSVRQDDSLVAMPVSLAATALKIVALRRRILVEELVEELWPESAPGVGMRRLRNVLWRIRVACGEILVREDKFIVLSPSAVTDAEVFRRLGSQALDASTPADKAADLAQAALRLYEGELLPADRYADWAAAARESLGRLRVQLIELRVAQATEEERVQEALTLIDTLIESDPYEEAHYMRAAELHLKSGNRKRALATLGRAERTLAEFGLPPSARMRRLAESLA